MKMIRFLLFALFYIFGADAGELIIVRSPSSVNFKGDDPIDQHLIPEIFSAAVGFTTQQGSDWNGMTITDPFNFAEAVVVLFIDGVPGLGQLNKYPRYTVFNNEDEYITWKTLKNKIIDRYPLENNTLLNIELSQSEDGEQFNIKTKHLNKNTFEDAGFLKEISNLNKYLKNEEKSNGVPDLYWFNMRSLHPLMDMKDSNDASILEAKEMVLKSLEKMGDAFEKYYQNQALVVALLSDSSHTRKTRSILDPAENVTEDVKDNIYDPDFPVIFNIILWFTVALVFSLLAVSVFIASMDPGRDSIIYRMTSNRMKKDS